MPSHHSSLEVNLDGRRHGRLDVDLANVLPLLLEKRRQKVGRELRVDDNVLLRHFHVSDGNVQAHDLLHLELDGGLDFVNLFLHVVSSSQESRELTGLGETGSEQTRDLLDHVVRGHEKVVTLGKLLDQLFVLVELFQVFDRHVSHANTIGLFTMGSVTQHAALELGAGNSGELESTRETLVTNRVVVLQGNLSFNGFGEVTFLTLDGVTVDGAFLAGGVLENVLDGFLQNLRAELGHGLVVF
mmetsp:Transcript_11676/g.22374  ORF Transcript_11676/g.22374 Transcript_11676/m.22374 type:complete len:243 (-) Transcript_11676:79-807(-)